MPHVVAAHAASILVRALARDGRGIVRRAPPGGRQSSGARRRLPAWTAGRARYVARFPDSHVTFELGDFTLHRLEFLRGVYVEGFARAIAVPADDIRRLGD